MKYGTVGTGILIASLLPLVFNGHGSSEDKQASKEAEKIAEEVRRKAESTQKG